MIIDGQRKKKGKRKEKRRKNFLLAAYKKEKSLTAEIYFLQMQEAKAERRKKKEKSKEKKREEKEKQKIIEHGQKGKREKRNAERGLKAHRTRTEAACFILQFKTCIYPSGLKHRNGHLYAHSRQGTIFHGFKKLE